MSLFTKKYAGAQEWEHIKNKGENIFSPKMYRSKVPGGWLITTGITTGFSDVRLTFMPDPEHEWELKKLSESNF